jgi:glycosyltransferase involved in cell wall biosynthesis
MRSISVIVPLFNEEQALRELHDGIAAELESLDADAEIIYVDDGSTDRSFEVVKALQAEDPRIRIVRFRRNFGKSAALSAGFREARGEIIVTIDADLQDLPSEMHRLVFRLEEGHDLVSGWKKDRQDPIGKRWPSKIFNFVTSFLTGVPLHDMNCGFKAYRREVVEEIRVYGEMHRYIPVLASYRGFRVGEIPVEHRRRPYGTSKYGVGRFFGGFFDLMTVIMLTRYNRKPLHAFGIFGVILFSSGLLIELYLTVGWFFGRWIEYRPALLFGILMLIVGIQFVFFGLLAEMIAYSTRRDEDFSIKEIVEGGEGVGPRRGEIREPVS